MLRTICVLAALLTVGGVLLAGQLVIAGTGRFEFIVDLELDGVRYTGSTVRELAVRATPDILPAGVLPQYQVRGEAVEIPIDSQRTLFALMRDTESISSHAYGSEYIGCIPGDSFREVVSRLRDFRGDCSLELRPKIVILSEDGTFEEIRYLTDRQSGFVLHSVTAAGTGLPVARGIEQRHPALKSLPSGGPVWSSTVPFYRQDFSR